jgi:hypothetical protein
LTGAAMLIEKAPRGPPSGRQLAVADETGLRFSCADMMVLRLA